VATGLVDVSLTDFLDFAIRAGTPKLTKVAEVKRRGQYSPAADYWRPLREKIQELHESGSFDIKALEQFAGTYADPKKVERYSAAVRGYKRFLGRKAVSWLKPPYSVWTPSRLRVRINPEVGLRVAGSKYILKLYFKNERLSKYRVDLLTFLLRHQLSQSAPGAEFGVLDVANARLFPASQATTDLMPLLLGEAASFVAIWDGIGAL